MAYIIQYGNSSHSGISGTMETASEVLFALYKSVISTKTCPNNTIFIITMTRGKIWTLICSQKFQVYI